jgi:hypothetical protein
VGPNSPEVLTGEFRPLTPSETEADASDALSYDERGLQSTPNAGTPVKAPRQGVGLTLDLGDPHERVGPIAHLGVLPHKGDGSFRRATGVVVGSIQASRVKATLVRHRPWIASTLRLGGQRAEDLIDTVAAIRQLQGV